MVTTSPASASITVGQVAPPNPDPACDSPLDVLQPTVISGNSFVVPSTGGVTSWTVTSWSHSAAAGVGQMLTLKFFRMVADPAIYMVVGYDGPRPLAGGSLNTFAASMVVKSGDVLGVGSANAGTVDNACGSDAPGEELLFHEGELADGGSGAFETDSPFRVNATADLTPTSDFTFGKLKRKPNGTAVLTVNVPNPGALKVSGKGVRGSSAGAVAAKKVPAAGTAKLVIRARGKKRAKLADTGKVKVKAKIVYTPTGGVANTKSRKVKLRQK